MSACRLLVLAVGAAAALSLGSVCWAVQPASKLTLNFRLVPREGREGRATPKLDVDHADLGPVCELQCYETGPFQVGDGVKKEDGSVVFSYQSGDMTCTTTCTTIGDDRVQALTEIRGSFDDVKKVPYLGACLQFQRSQLFTRVGPLQEFGKRCFIYTMRGPVMGFDTARGKMTTNFAPDAPENNPPMVQWYVPIDRMHPGDIWQVVGTAGDRPIVGLVGCTSRDGKWVTGYGAQYNRTIGQLFMPCIHVVPDVQMHVDLKASTVRYREMIYVMPNDPQKLLQAFREDFPAPPAFETSPAAAGALLLKPAAEGVLALELKLDLVGGAAATAGEWKPTWWGTFIQSGDTWRAWAHPHGEALDLCVSFKADVWNPETARAVATLTGQGWTSVAAPEGTAAQVLRSADGKWTALLFWQRADAAKPASGVPAADQPEAGVISVRGRVLLGETASLDAAQRKGWADTDWEHAKPYRMPLSDPLP